MNEQKGQDKQLLKVSSLEEIRKSFKLRIEENRKELQIEKEQSSEARPPDGQRNYQIFTSILETFWAEGHLSDVQKNLIERKKIALAIPDDVAKKIEEEVKNKYRNKIEEINPKKEDLTELQKEGQHLNTLLYRTMLESTLIDGDFTEEETLYLRRKKIELEITDEEAILLETQVRTELKKTGEKISSEKSLPQVNKITLHRHPRSEDITDKKPEIPYEEITKVTDIKTEPEKPTVKPLLTGEEELKKIETKPEEEPAEKSDEETKKQALRLKWLAEEEALKIQEDKVSGEKTGKEEKPSEKSEEEAKKQSLRLKWLAEEEALKIQEQKADIQPEEEARKLEEEELARKAQEEFIKAEEELHKKTGEELEKSEEAKKQALRLKWLAEEEALKQQEGKISAADTEDEMKGLEEELARKAQEEFRRAEEEARKFEEELARRAQEALEKSEEEARKLEEELAQKAQEEFIRAEEEARKLEEERAGKSEKSEEDTEKAGREELSEEEAKKQALRLKWLAEEESLKEQEQKPAKKVSDEEQMSREEAEKSEEAKKQALRLKWIEEEEKLKKQHGEPLAEPVVRKESVSICPECKAENRANAKFCKGCGLNMYSVSPAIHVSEQSVHEEELKRAEEEARRLAEEEARRVEEEFLRQSEEELKRAEEEAIRLAEEEARRAEEEFLKEAEEELTGKEEKKKDINICVICKSENRITAKFCHTCGGTLPVIQEGDSGFLKKNSITLNQSVSKATIRITEDELNLDNVKCPVCYSENRMNARFCKSCGVNLQELTVFCANCREQNRGIEKYCKSCGFSLYQEEVIDTEISEYEYIEIIGYLFGTTYFKSESGVSVGFDSMFI
ncbi:MAG: zinc ribbon domain-containing protein [Candidatus Eremiobacterota bacterium]